MDIANRKPPLPRIQPMIDAALALPTEAERMAAVNAVGVAAALCMLRNAGVYVPKRDEFDAHADDEFEQRGDRDACEHCDAIHNPNAACPSAADDLPEAM